MRIFLRIIESVSIYILLLRIFKRVFSRNSKVYSKVEFRELKSLVYEYKEEKEKEIEKVNEKVTEKT